MSATHAPPLPATFNRLAWSNLAAQSAEQIALAAAPIVAVLLLGVGEGQTGLLQTGSEAAGVLRINCSLLIAQYQIAPLVPEFLEHVVVGQH